MTGYDAGPAGRRGRARRAGGGRGGGQRRPDRAAAGGAGVSAAAPPCGSGRPRCPVRRPPPGPAQRCSAGDAGSSRHRHHRGTPELVVGHPADPGRHRGTLPGRRLLRHQGAAHVRPEARHPHLLRGRAGDPERYVVTGLPAPPDGEAPGYYGVYPAIVTAIVDDQRLGRVQVRYPMAGRGRRPRRAGLGDALLALRRRRRRAAGAAPRSAPRSSWRSRQATCAGPTFVGCAWNGQETLPHEPAESNDIRLFRSRADSRLEFDDTRGAARVRITMASGPRGGPGRRRPGGDGPARRRLHGAADGDLRGGAGERLGRRHRADGAGGRAAGDVQRDRQGRHPDRRADGRCRRPTPRAPGTSGERPPVHPMALRAPWYACERDNIDRFDHARRGPGDPEVRHSRVRPPGAGRPVGLAEVRRPGMSGRFPCRAARRPGCTTFRQRLSPYRQASSTLLKLYQPSHDRFYTVGVELFCDTPGLPRPGPGDDVSVRFVVRRLVTRTGTDAQPRPPRSALVRWPPRKLYGTPFPKHRRRRVGTTPVDPGPEKAEDLAGLFGVDGLTDEQRARHEAVRGPAPPAAAPGRASSGSCRAGTSTTPGQAAGRRSRRRTSRRRPGTEQELPMWRVAGRGLPGSGEAVRCRSDRCGSVRCRPTPASWTRRACPGSTTAAPTSSSASRGGRRPGCPPLESRSAVTRPYRLAAFFDPAGTANHQIHVRLPDFAAWPRTPRRTIPRAGWYSSGRPAPSCQLARWGTIPAGPRGHPGGDSGGELQLLHRADHHRGQLRACAVPAGRGVRLPAVVAAAAEVLLAALRGRGSGRERARRAAPITGLGRDGPPSSAGCSA